MQFLVLLGNFTSGEKAHFNHVWFFCLEHLRFSILRNHVLKNVFARRCSSLIITPGDHPKQTVWWLSKGSTTRTQLQQTQEKSSTTDYTVERTSAHDFPNMKLVVLFLLSVATSFAAEGKWFQQEYLMALCICAPKYFLTALEKRSLASLLAKFLWSSAVAVVLTRTVGV